MSGFLLAVGLFTAAFVIHVVVWRTRPPQATGQALILLFVLSILGGAMLLWLGGLVSPGLHAWLPSTVGAWSQAVIAALAVACVYVMNYPAVEVESPTLVIADLFASVGSRGLTREELYARLGDDFLVMPRIEDLLREGLAVDVAGKFRLTPKGLRLKRVFSAWRRILGAGLGG